MEALCPHSRELPVLTSIPNPALLQMPRLPLAAPRRALGALPAGWAHTPQVDSRGRHRVRPGSGNVGSLDVLPFFQPQPTHGLRVQEYLAPRLPAWGLLWGWGGC